MSVTCFCCSQCLGSLCLQKDAYHCDTCGTIFPISFKVPDFSAKSDYHYGEFPLQTMQELLGEAESLGTAQAIEHALANKPPHWREYFLHYALDECRAAWQFLLPLPEHAQVLDFGCGWGNLAISLARNFATVYAMDIMPERAAFGRIRASEMGLNNLIALAGGNTPRLPFADAQLDAVVLNGVLEWVPCSLPHIADPREAQLQVLREIHRILRPDGQLYIGIENRMGFRYFFGRPDEHTKLKFATLLPRGLANGYSYWKRGEAYRNYTYTWRGYRKLLREAGFADSQFYSPYPEYREFRHLIPLRRAQILGQALHPSSLRARVALQFCSRLNIFRELSSSYSIFAAKQLSVAPYAERLLARIGLNEFSNSHFLVTRTATALLFTPNAVVRLPLTARATARAQMEARNLKQIHPAMPKLIPQPIAEGEFQGQYYFARQAISGVAGIKLYSHPGQNQPALQQAVDFLIELHTRTGKQCEATEIWLAHHFDRHVETISILAPELKTLTIECHRDLLRTPLLSVVSHGDFSLQNLLFAPKTNQLVGVIDWDLADVDGWPLVDMLHLFVAAEYETREVTTNAALLSVLKKLHKGGFERILWEKYLTCVPIEPAQRVWAVAAYLLSNIANKHEYGNQMVDPMLRTVGQDLGEARTLVSGLLG